MTPTQLAHKIDRIDRKISELAAQKNKKVWVKASDILKATGWDKYKLARARAAGTIEWKRSGPSFFYNIKSIDMSLATSFQKLIDTVFTRYNGVLIEKTSSGYIALGREFAKIEEAKAYIDTAFCHLQNTLK